MEVAKDELIQKLAEEGKDKAEVRRALISEGLSTEGFEVVYEKFAKKVPVTKPKQSKVQGQIIGDFASFETLPSSRKRSQSSGGKFIFSAILILLVVAGYLYVTGGLKITQFGQIDLKNDVIINDIQSFNIGDKLLQGKVESAAASAHLFERRMGSLEGVCNDIILVDPVECLGTNESFVIFAPVSDSKYYCVDAKGLRENLENRPVSGESCQ